MASHDPEPRGWASQLRREVAGLISKYTEIGLTPAEVADDVIDVVISRYVTWLSDEEFHKRKLLETPSDAEIESFRAALRSYDPVREIERSRAKSDG